MNLSKFASVDRISNAVAAGQTQIDTDSVDTKGYTSALFEVGFGAITAGAVTSVHVAGSHDDAAWADLEGTSVTVADDDDNGVVIIDVDQPRHRYLRVEVVRGTQNAAVDYVTARLYKHDREPVTHSANVIASEHHVAPAEGTP